MLLRISRALWGDLSREEVKKFGILSSVMMLIIGNYWMLRITKDPIFDMLVGFRQWQPVVKMVSLFAMIFLVLGYSKLVDIFSRQRLIYLMCSFYGTMFLLLSYFISYPEMLSISESSALYPFVSWIPGKALGWFAYVLLESYGSLLIALFYSFVASVMTTDSAKKGYGMMFFIIQVGTLSGVLLSMFVAKWAGHAAIYFVGGLFVLCAPFIIKAYLKAFPGDYEESQEGGKSKKKTGFFEGLRLIATKPYIMGIFVVAAFYEIMSTIVEYQMNWIAVGVYTNPSDYIVFRGYQALGINSLAFLFALVGTSFFMRKFGLKFCLLAFPMTIATVIGISFLAHMSGANSYLLMWILLLSTVAIKGLNYTLNKPTAEVMYIPTSKDVKFKCKGWIDSFGNRSTKGTGSVVTKTFGASFPILMLYGALISFGFIALWLFVARYVGNKFNELQETDTIIE